MLHQTGVHGMSPAHGAGLGLGCRASVAGLSRVEWAPARWDLPAQAQQSCRFCLVSQPQNWHRSCAVGGASGCVRGRAGRRARRGAVIFWGAV